MDSPPFETVATPLVLWMPQSYAESAEPFWTTVPSSVSVGGGATARPIGETAPGDRVWIAIRVGGLHDDFTSYEVATHEGDRVAATIRILPRGAGVSDLLKKGRKVDPANIVAFVILAVLFVGYLVFG